MEADLAATRGGRDEPEESGGPAGGASRAFKSPYELVQMEKKRTGGAPVAAVPAFAHVSGGML
jgi:hypothetical protein